MTIILTKEQGGAQLRHPCYAARGGHRHSAGVAMLDQFPTHPSPGDPRGKAPASRLDNVIALAKKRGFVFPSGEIYGGTRSAWDYGPLGVEIKENIKKQWWRTFVQSRADMVGLDSSIILPRRVWEASGHVETFTDPLVECKSCHNRF